MKGVSMILRRLTRSGRTSLLAAGSSSIGENLILSSAATVSYFTLADVQPNPLFTSQIALTPNSNLQSFHVYSHSRSFSSSASSDPSNIVLIESEEQFTNSLRKVQDESLPAIFYFTAVWCGPCRLLSPIIGQLSEKYPHVTTYKIDIDKEELGNALSKLNIHSPTLHFFQNGKKASEVIGADVERLRDTMEALYK
ncbi:thioredoxin O2, mitochondrial-like [Olea europaea subsp. europaea]|uniref:Thioredoxin O2, mitochondrial-like n=1 Tax=Olea europaea subsp. europaea TaxID=158383 RepID=A0A8S0UY01_OLEEU|nr:thioredoxin O2, mitochondrial-like [Olea europaea subsp. europaea]